MHVDIKPNLKRDVRVPDGNRSRDPIAGEILYHVIIIIIIKKKNYYYYYYYYNLYFNMVLLHQQVFTI